MKREDALAAVNAAFDDADRIAAELVSTRAAFAEQQLALTVLKADRDDLAARLADALKPPPIQLLTAADFAKAYLPGAVLTVPKGVVIQGPVTLKSAGTADKPIMIKGPGQIKGGSAKWTDALTIGSYVVVDGVLLTDTNRNGVIAPKGTTGAIVQNCEMTRVGIGATLAGSASKMLNCFVHDLTMVNNTQKAVNPDDDYGANGVLLTGDGHEVAYNRFVGCVAPSFDYGEDGGGVELWGSVSHAYIHHNWCENSAGFLEAGGQAGDVIRDVLVEFNVGLNLRGCPFFNPHNGGGQFAATFKNVAVRRNTIVATTATPKAMGTFYLDAAPAPGAFDISDNIVSLNSGDSVFKWEGAYHSGNVFQLQDKATHLFNNWSMALGPGETMADPLFSNVAAKDFTLKPGSPAAGKGAL